MIFVKITGCIFVFLSCTMFGFSIKLKTESRLNNLKNLQLCTVMFENEIRYNASDITHIIKKVSEIANDINSEFFKILTISSKNNPDRPLSEIWAETTEEICKLSTYNQKDKETIIFFGNMFGSGDVETQLKNLDLFQRKINLLIQECEEKCSKNSNLYSKAGMYLGAIITILLI